MKFGPVPTEQAQGAILAHSIAVTGGRLRKGLLLDNSHIQALGDAGHDSVIVARLEPGDLHENEAAQILAEALLGARTAIHLTDPFTGRVNLIADGPGVVRLDANALCDANEVNPMITVATVPAWQQMGAGQMVATVKIISYGVPEADLRRAADIARASISLMPPVHETASLIVTEIPGGPGDKGAGAITNRIKALGMRVAEIVNCPHETSKLAQAVAAASGDVVLILTASATSDEMDTAPEAVRQADGHVERFGMPVDPGNLLFLGSIGQRPVIGLPGCARAQALNGTDWVLSRVACGIDVTGVDIAGMGVGGLLKEIPTRPMPRRGKPRGSE